MNNVDKKWILIISNVLIVVALSGCAQETGSHGEEAAYSHLYEQMDRYEDGSALRLIRSYAGTSTNPDDCMVWVYDNDLAILALIDRGTPEDMSRAKIPGSAVFCGH